jgi:hypothetical protein
MSCAGYLMRPTLKILIFSADCLRQPAQKIKATLNHVNGVDFLKQPTQKISIFGAGCLRQPTPKIVSQSEMRKGHHIDRVFPIARCASLHSFLSQY